MLSGTDGRRGGGHQGGTGAGRPVADRVRHESWLSWVVAPAGLATGAALAPYLSGLAVSRLQNRQVRILRVLADAER